MLCIDENIDATKSGLEISSSMVNWDVTEKKPTLCDSGYNDQRVCPTLGDPELHIQVRRQV